MLEKHSGILGCLISTDLISLKQHMTNVEVCVVKMLPLGLQALPAEVVELLDNGSRLTMGTERTMKKTSKSPIKVTYRQQTSKISKFF